DDGYCAHLDRVLTELDAYVRAGRSWFERRGATIEGGAAYFSLEFGLHERLPLYSGGTGLLAADHIKSASDLGLPSCGISLLYQEGYFRQYLNADGWQLERYYDNEFAQMPIRLLKSDDGQPLKVSVELPGRLLHAQLWQIQVGRTPLYLLDANL